MSTSHAYLYNLHNVLTSAKCQKCQVPNAKCQVPKGAKCQMPSAKSAKCQKVPSANYAKGNGLA